MITEAILSAITEAVFGYVLEKSGAADWVLRELKLDPTHQGYKRALGKALESLEQEHPEWIENLFDASFFQNEGAPILAQFLIRDGHPDPSQLAARWADSLNLRAPERRTVHTRELEPVAADFLEDLARNLKAEPDLAELHDSRALERMAKDVGAIRRSVGAERATPGTRRDYLDWLIERNLYLDPRGTLQTQRQVQVRLDEVYISLRAQQEEPPGTVDRRLLEQELAELEARLEEVHFPAEEAEDQHEQILARFKGLKLDTTSGRAGEVVELARAVDRHDRLVVLGDPGSGKTTLLRYLALNHALALRDGRSEASSELGAARFPILVRIADYTENGAWRDKPLSEFLADQCTMHECPSVGLPDLLGSELAGGNCLVLVDGLDEIVDADDRRGVVGRIDDFVRRYDNQPNRFVITSRVAGYRSAPLGEPFAHYTVQEMENTQIRQFLERWCPAVEAAQTPDLSPEARQATAEREIEGVMRTVENSPGVRRLAANPLMLRTLALIHRTGAQLPQKRIELYKLAADTLARTWRIAHGVPESNLVDERYVTRLLGKMAYWLHVHKPTGIATEREVYAVLGEEWARINRLEWDEEDPAPEVLDEVESFLRAVREHTGLFVERAPKRYGFMHLTFEEYYAARHLVARRRGAARMIRQHLHDPRWEEPILLALGFVGLDYPEESAELLETAILAEGEEAKELGFAASPYEEILGRDFLFALRCLGDQIPADLRLTRELIEHLADELLCRTGSARFRRYQRALEERVTHLAGSDTATILAPLLVTALGDDDPGVRVTAAQSLGALGQDSPELVNALLAALGDDDPEVRVRAVASLGALGQDSPELVNALLAAMGDNNFDVRLVAALSLAARLGQDSPELVDPLLAALGDDDPDVRFTAMVSLLSGQDSPELVNALLSALGDDDLAVRSVAAAHLIRRAQDSPELVDPLLAALGDDNFDVRSMAAASLTQLGKKSPEVVVDTLLAAMRDDNLNVRSMAAASLGQLGQDSLDVIHALVSAMGDDNYTVRTTAAASLGQLGQDSSDVIHALISAMGDDNSNVRVRAAASLSQLGQDSPDIIHVLISAMGDDNSNVRVRAAASLSQLGQQSPGVIHALISAMGDDNHTVRVAAVESLGQLGQDSPDVIHALISAMGGDNHTVRVAAAASLGQLGQHSPDVVYALISAMGDDNHTVRTTAAASLGQLGTTDESLILALWRGLLDENNDVRAVCARSLASLGRRFPNAAEGIAEKLVKAIKDPEFDHPDRYSGRTSHDYAFDGLWLLITGGSLGESY